MEARRRIGGLENARYGAGGDDDDSASSSVNVKVEADVVDARISPPAVRMIPVNHSSAVTPKHEVIDLTLDSDDDDDDDIIETYPSTHPAHSGTKVTHNGGTVLITPLHTYLKVDRLGIGASLLRSTPTSTPNTEDARPRRVPLTHTSQAMQAPLSKQARNQQRQRMENKIRQAMQGGKGARAMSKTRKEEERKRVELIAYLKSG